MTGEKRARLRSALDLDKAPVTRREIVLWALALSCFAFEPTIAKTIAGVAASSAGVFVAWLSR